MEEGAVSNYQDELDRIVGELNRARSAEADASPAHGIERRTEGDLLILVGHPAALGLGLPLFSELARPIDLKLVSSTPFDSGAVAQIYRPA